MSFTSADNRAIAARQWSTASARSPPVLPRSSRFAISLCKAVKVVTCELKVLLSCHGREVCYHLHVASCWKCLKNVSLGVSSLCCSDILVVAVAAAMEAVVSQKRVFLEIESGQILESRCQSVKPQIALCDSRLKVPRDFYDRAIDMRMEEVQIQVPTLIQGYQHGESHIGGSLPPLPLPPSLGSC